MSWKKNLLFEILLIDRAEQRQDFGDLPIYNT